MYYKKPDSINEYQECTKQIQFWENKRKKLRPEVLNILEDVGEIDGLYINVAESLKTDDEKILNWINEKYPELKDEVIKPALDWEKFESLIKLQKINVNQIPQESYKIISTQRIMERKPKDENKV